MQFLFRLHLLPLLLILFLFTRQNILHAPPDTLTQADNRLVSQPHSRLGDAVVLCQRAVSYLRPCQIWRLAHDPEHPFQDCANRPRRVSAQVPDTRQW